MTSKKRINKYKQGGKTGLFNSFSDQNPTPFRRTRRHSWFGALVNNDNTPTAIGSTEVQKTELSLDALDLKHSESPSLIERAAAHVLGFTSDSVCH